MITDIDGNEISYIPISLAEGETSPPVILRITPELETDILRGTSLPEALMLGSFEGGAYLDLEENPVTLAPYFGSYIDLLLKIQAGASVPGVSRFYLFLGVKRSSPAGWEN